jgi:hypothetical protein
MSLALRAIKKEISSPSYNDLVSHGPYVSPQKRLQIIFDDKEWERFTEEYAYGLSEEYCSVLRTGGAGDKGVDIAAFKSEEGFEGGWDNYQCKHYDHPLAPSDILLEIAKVCYYTFIQEYTVPDKYFFVGPYGVGTKLSKFLRGKQQDLKSLLVEKWSEKCEDNITSTKKITLDGEFKDYLQNFDFKIFKDVPVLRLLEVHRKTPYYHTRFGGGLPIRPVIDAPPEDIADLEVIYIKKLFHAYAEYLQLNECKMENVEADSSLKHHLQKARIQFYSAESLFKFSRDYLPQGEYERLQDFIYEGIENIILSNHNNGFEKVKQAIQEAYKIQIDSHPLKERLEPLDRAGICHQLANNNRLKWAQLDGK